MLLLLASVGMPVLVSFLLFVFVLLVCIPASRIVAGLVERKQNTFTVAGAAFAATIILPWVVLAARPLAARFLNREIPIVPTFAAMAIAYALGESIGRLACLSFGCCYGMPLRDAKPAVAKLFQKHNLVISGSTKKAAYASGLAGEPLIPVQAITSAIFAVSGIVGVTLFLAQQFRLASLDSGACQLGMACLLRVVARRLSRHVTNLGLPDDGGDLRGVFRRVPRIHS